jgi:hypothetical protein
MIENSPFCYNRHRVKAIVLGADPGNFSDHGKAVEIKVAFGIGSGDARYFNSILKNLNLVGLTLTDIYVQNLISIHPGEETSKFKNWEKFANRYLPLRIEEFKEIKPNIPVLVTAERILRYLVNKKLPNAEDIYRNSLYHLIAASENKLNRPLIPFFRNPKYNLDDDRWFVYRLALNNMFK